MNVPVRRVFVCLHCRRSSSWAAAVSSASRLVDPKDHVPIDPLKVVGSEMSNLTKNIRSLLGSGHPSLDTIAKYYISSEGKHIRPLIVLLMARAASVTSTLSSKINEPISPLNILNDTNPGFSPLTKEYELDAPSQILPSQRRLAEITEMIHAASLLHDDVIDNASSRRGKKSGNSAFGNKMAILAGDFLLGRASVALARLRDAEVIELLATVIANLVEGEFMQLKNTLDNSGAPTSGTFDYYLQKTYLKTASLISKSCRAAAILGGANPEVIDAAYNYGRGLGLAFQLVDDMLDYTNSESQLGKPAGADLQLGLATAPVLYAWEKYPELGPMINRKFAHEGDIERARYLVKQSEAVERTRALAQSYADAARNALRPLRPSEAKDALQSLAEKVTSRQR